MSLFRLIPSTTERKFSIGSPEHTLFHACLDLNAQLLEATKHVRQTSQHARAIKKCFDLVVKIRRLEAATNNPDLFMSLYGVPLNSLLDGRQGAGVSNRLSHYFHKPNK